MRFSSPFSCNPFFLPTPGIPAILPRFCPIYRRCTCGVVGCAKVRRVRIGIGCTACHTPLPVVARAGIRRARAQPFSTSPSCDPRSPPSSLLVSAQNEQIFYCNCTKDSFPASVKVCLGSGPSSAHIDSILLALAVPCPRQRHLPKWHLLKFSPDPLAPSEHPRPGRVHKGWHQHTTQLGRRRQVWCASLPPLSLPSSPPC